MALKAAEDVPHAAPSPPAVAPTSLEQGFRLEQDGNVVHVYNVDFPLWSIVRASTAAPTYFPREYPLLDVPGMWHRQAHIAQ
jgi:hypothetical protein